MTILILNGPNMNLLGTREPQRYGRATLDDLEASLREVFPDVTFQFFHSNSEGGLIDRLHQAHREGVNAVVFNPGGYTHTSVALRDAVAAIDPPVMEVHLSNLYTRELFRHQSMIAPVCTGQIVGLGHASYHLGVRYFLDRW